MKVIHYQQVEAAAVEMEGAAGCRIRCLIGPDDNAPSFTMREFEIAPGGHTPQHAHGHEHEVFVLEGTGVVSEGGGGASLAAGDRGLRAAEADAPVPQHRRHAAAVPLPDSASAPRRGRFLPDRLRLRVSGKGEGRKAEGGTESQRGRCQNMSRTEC